MDNIKDVVHALMGKLSVSTVEGRRSVEDIVSGMLNDQEKKHVRFSGMKEGKIFMVVDSSAWLFQMRTKQQRLLKEIQLQVSDVTQMYFKIGKVL